MPSAARRPAPPVLLAVVLLVLSLASTGAIAYAVMTSERTAAAGAPGATPTTNDSASSPTQAASGEATGEATGSASVRLTVVGDSVACGFGTTGGTKKDGFAAQAGARLGWETSIDCAPYTGYVRPAKQAPVFMGRLDQIVATNPDVIVVEGSSNDFEHSTEEIRTAAEEFFTALHQRLPDATIYAQLAFYVPGHTDEMLDRCREGVRQAAEATDVTVLDTEKPEAWLGQDDFADSVHPNDAGHAALTEHLVAALEDATR